MSAFRHPEPMEEKRSEWLALARQQSQILARARELRPPPLDWEALEQRQRAAAPPLLRLSWVVPALAVLLIGGATATWALISHLGQREREPVREGSRMVPLGNHARVTTSARAAGQTGTAPRPAAASDERQPAAAPVRPVPGKAVKDKARRRAVGARLSARGKEVKEPPPGTQRDPASDTNVIFGEQDIPGGGEVIIVSPPSRLGPLWTPEAFKHKGPGQGGL